MLNSVAVSIAFLPTASSTKNGFKVKCVQNNFKNSPYSFKISEIVFQTFVCADLFLNISEICITSLGQSKLRCPFFCIVLACQK